MNNKIVIVAALSSVSKRVRLFKITKFLHGLGVKQFEHIAWERKKGESVEQGLDFDLQKTVILRGGGHGGIKVRLMYFFWILKVFIKSFTIKKNDIVWALGFESAFPMLLSSRIKGFKLYFDDADRFSMIIRTPFPLNRIIEKLEMLTSRKAYKHIVPAIERYDFESENFFLLQNTPSLSEIKEAFKLYTEKEWLKAKIIININGLLSDGRGLDIALKLYDKLEKEDVGFILAGRVDCVSAKILKEKDKVQYLGEVTNAEALSSYFASDFVFTYYDPKMKVNQMAASNKWGDAIFTNTGIIVNDEIKTAASFIKNGVAISHPYNDFENLADEIMSYSRDIDRLKKMQENLNCMKLEFSYFEDQLERLFS